MMNSDPAQERLLGGKWQSFDALSHSQTQFECRDVQSSENNMSKSYNNLELTEILQNHMTHQRDKEYKEIKDRIYKDNTLQNTLLCFMVKKHLVSFCTSVLCK